MDVWCEGCGCYMEKAAIGVITEVGPGRIVRHGDRYVCQRCTKTVISDFGQVYDEVEKAKGPAPQ